jgi:DhnA family fructose-bisphosphate aldolase class Ia
LVLCACFGSKYGGRNIDSLSRGFANDVITYAAQIAAQLGAHIIKVKLPTDRIEQQAAREVYQKMQIPLA